MEIKKFKYLFLLIVFAALFFAYNYHQTLLKHPQSTHQWRQCDGSAIVMHYYHNGLNPFEPGVYNLHGNGKTVAEFPIVYYIDACVISMVGFKHRDAVIRLVNLLLLYIGLFYLFKIGLLFYTNWYWAILPMLLYAAFPIVAFYGFTSVPNVPASSFSFVGIYYLFKYIKVRRKKYLWIAISSIALVGMIKATALIPYLSIYGVLMFSLLFNKGKIQIKTKDLLLLLIPLLATFAWVYTASLYNNANENVTFLMSAKPIWELDRKFIDEISYRMKYSWMPYYLFIPILWISLAIGLAFLFWNNKKMTLIKYGLILITFGSAAYLYLFFEQFYHHDYYAIELLPWLLAWFMAGIYLLSEIKVKQNLKNVIFYLLLILMVVNVGYCRNNMILRYTKDASYNDYNDVYAEAYAVLKENGIKYSDKVIVSSDRSPNISLYLMDQIGWTRFPYGMDNEKVENYVNEGAKYLISLEEDLINRPYLKPYTLDTIVHYKNLLVFKL